MIFFTVVGGARYKFVNDDDDGAFLGCLETDYNADGDVAVRKEDAGGERCTRMTPRPT